jgi:adenylosuccinate synthase
MSGTAFPLAGNELNHVRYLVLLSGPLAVGKTALREELVAVHGFDYVRSGRYLLDRAQREALDGHRRGLQELGDELDRNTDFRWLLDDVAIPTFRANPNTSRWLVDAVRKLRQVEHFKGTFGASVFHVHLTAPEEVLKARYEARRAVAGKSADQTPYEQAIAHVNEVAARGLVNVADLKLDVSTMTPEEAARRILAGRHM